MRKEAVLIHGWDPNFYNRNCPSDISEDAAWQHRRKLISFLSNRFKLYFYNLPGFCQNPEPPNKFYKVDDFADSLAGWFKSKNLKPKVIIGYSFGGAVALTYKARYHDPTPVVLLSPALARRESARSDVARGLKKFVPDKTYNSLKACYQFIFSRYYRQGTPFLRTSYDHIVRKNLSSLLLRVKPNEVLFIYGREDSSTPWKMVEKEINEWEFKYLLLENGNHNIGQTHPEEIVEAIRKFLAKQDNFVRN